MKPCYIFDIDGTLANGDHRLPHIQKTPKDWTTYFSLCPDDKPILPVIKLARDLHRAGHNIVYFSGRSDEVRKETEIWLRFYDLPASLLFMRAQGDHKDDDILKGEFLDALQAMGYSPTMVFDDRNRVVKMWRARGIVCAQVAEGDF